MTVVVRPRVRGRARWPPPWTPPSWGGLSWPAARWACSPALLPRPLPPSSLGPSRPASPAALALAVGGFAAYQALSFTVLCALDPARHTALGIAKRAFVADAGAALASTLATGGKEANPRHSWPSAGGASWGGAKLARAHCHAASTRGAVVMSAAPAAAAVPRPTLPWPGVPFPCPLHFNYCTRLVIPSSRRKPQYSNRPRRPTPPPAES